MIAVAGDSPAAHYGEFGLGYFPNANGYKQYEGQVVVYQPKQKPSYEDDQFVKSFYGKFNTRYIIKKVSGNEKLIKFELVEESNPSSKVKFEFLNYPEFYTYGKRTFTNTEHNRVPLFFSDVFENAKPQYIGKQLKAQNDVYLQIKDLSLYYPIQDSYAVPCFNVYNALVDSITSVPISNVDFYTSNIGRIIQDSESDKYLQIVNINELGYKYLLIDPLKGKKMEVNTLDFDIKENIPEIFAHHYFTASNSIGEVFSDPECNFNLTVMDADVKVLNKYHNAYSYTILDSSTGKVEVASKPPKEYAETRFSQAKQGKCIAILSKIIKPSNSNIRYGKTKEVKDDDVTMFSYIDNIIDITIVASNQQFSFILKNLSPNSIKIIWDEAAIIDINGSTSKVMHSGTKYSERNASQSPTTIISNAKIEDIACPTDKARYSDYYNTWVNDSMFLNDKSMKGKQLKLMLPIQIKNVINEYIFVFDIDYVPAHPELLNSK